MQVANICPSSLLTLVLDVASTYHLVLASQVLRDPDYARFYRACSERGDTVILDNDAHENGASLGVEQLTTAALLVSPTVIVLPDSLRATGLENFELAQTSLPQLRYSASQFMAVPHGSDLADYLNCAVNMAKLPGVSILGIYRLEKDHDSTRERVIRALTELPVTFHLLGAGPDYRELAGAFLRWRCCGVDTAKFIQAGLEGTRLNLDTPRIDRPRRDASYFTGNYAGTNTRLIRNNIAYWRNVCY